MGKRTKKQSCPNPLFLKCLQEWRDEAREKGRSNLQHAYNKALSSIRKYPMPLRNGQEAMILEGVGPNIAKKLDEAFAAYQEHGEPVVSKDIFQANDIPYTAAPHEENGRTVEDSQIKKKMPRKQSDYTPGYRTGAYALLLTLYRDRQRNDSVGFMKKDNLLKKAQSLSDKSFTLPDPGSRYTAWSSMSTLIKKGLAIKNSNPAKYFITPDGCEMAEKLAAVSVIDGNISCGSQARVPFVICNQPRSSTSRQTQAQNDNHADNNGILTSVETPEKRPMTTVNHVEDSPVREESSSITIRNNNRDFTPEFMLKPGYFDIVLCVDFIETTGGSSNSRKDALVKELTNNGVNFDIRKLQVGDFLWIAREKARPLSGESTVPEAKELVLDYIIERKRMDDLNSSIIDGRFREQKFRLGNCGLQHPIYLVENFGSAQNLSLPETTLKQAIVNTQVIEGFFVKRTHDIKESVAYLTLMTRFIQSFYLDKTLIACPRDELEKTSSGYALSKSEINIMTFQEFSKETAKNKVVTVSEMFGKQLMQISGMSADKASAVLSSYPTPRSLLEAYNSQPTTEQKETMLSSLKYGRLQRKFGPSLSKLVYMLYYTRGSLS